jgi:formylglycine-generating enzyme required for sulfatase activity
MIRKLIVLFAIAFLVFGCDKATKAKETVTKPVFSPAAGTYLSEKNIEITCPTSGATIRYTLDGSDPTESSPIYTSLIALTQGTTIKARAYKSDMKPSLIAEAIYNFEVAAITIAPAGGTFSTPQSVAIIHVTQGTVIHYTLDGTEPTEDSPIYTTQILISSTTTLKAKGFKPGWVPTATKTEVYVFGASQPTFSVSEGLYYNTFDVTLSSNTAGASIYYTTDGSEPDMFSTLYSTPININVSKVIKAKAFKESFLASSVATASYELKVVAVSFSPLPGYFYTTQNVAITTTTDNTTIYYTTNGNDPTTSSSVYASPVVISANSNLKAVAYKTGWTPSNITSGAYSFNVHSPTFDIPSGQYVGPLTVHISCQTPGAVIRYTTNGVDPSSSSSQYTDPLVFTTSTTLKAKAYMTGMNASPVVLATYTIGAVQPVATPTFSPLGGNFNTAQSITISCATSNATIRYTTDGSEPDENSTAYTIPISLSQTTTLKAKGYKTGWYDSPTTSAQYNITFNPAQMILVPAGTFTMGRTTGTGETDELPTHAVTVSSFYIGKYEVTQAQWIEIMGSNPAYFAEDHNRPVEMVNWYAALVYCNKRSTLESFNPVYSINGSTNTDNWGTIPIVNDATWNAVICDWTANGYRLPTEAEWEYAARGATNTPDYLYAGSNNGDEVIWYQVNSGATTHIVGHKLPNGLGIYDMSGNVNEWCWDWYSSTYYTSNPQTNPTGPTDGSYRIIRGGSWNSYNTNLCRVVRRNGSNVNNLVSERGLRVVRKAN